MEYQAFEDRKHSGDCWRVEAFDNDGRCFVAIFAGPEAKQRAEEYAHWKKHEHDRPSAKTSSHA
jgi:hypothetical protein